MKKVLFSACLAALAVSASAQEILVGYQEDVNAVYERVTERGPYLTNKFFDNMFLGVGGGVNMFYGKGDKDASKTFKGRLAPALDVSLGKWITPSVGLRLQYTGLQAKGFSHMQNAYTDGPINEDGLYPKKFNVMNLHGDVLWNISNAIGGFRNDRFWDFIPYVGFGYARSWMDDTNIEELAATAGLLNTMRISDVVKITLEARGMMTKRGLDLSMEGSKNFMTSLTAGLQVNFGPKGGFQRPIYVAPADYTPYNQRINALESELGAAISRGDKLQSELNAERNKPMQGGAVKADVPVSMQVFFKINSAVITEEGMLNLERLAQAIKATPNQKYVVAGYADSATGTPNFNQQLSRQRADAVVKALTQKFGVPASQLEGAAKGGVKMYKQNYLDRTVIVAQ